MPRVPKSTAERLLDAQVEFVLAELTGDRFAALVAEVVNDVLDAAATTTLAELVDRDDAKALVRTVAQSAGGSELMADYADVVSGALYDFAPSDEHLLGDVVDRAAVDALVAKLLSMRQLHDRILDRLAESPTVATIMSGFVSRVVGDVVAQNRARAEKVPGVSSLFSIGTSAASRMKSVGDQLLGDVSGKGATYTVKRTNSTIRDVIRDEQLQAGAMEVWDLQADEPVGELRSYLTAQDLRELVGLVHALVADAGTTEYAGLLLDECVDVFFDRYDEHDLATLLAELGVRPDDLVAHVTALAPPVIEASREHLARRIRASLEPFFRSEAVAAILA